MNHERAALILVAVCFGLSPAYAASPAAKNLLAAPLQDLQREGFYGADKAAVPDAPPTPAPTASAQAPDDHSKEVLRAFSADILSGGARINLSGIPARKLGFAPTPAAPWNADGTMPLRGVFRRSNSTGETKIFCATDVRGKTEIILVYMKDNDVIRAYLVSPDGILGAGVLYKSDGTVADIPSAQAQAEYEAELGFWVRYYDKTHPAK